MILVARKLKGHWDSIYQEPLVSTSQPEDEEEKGTAG